MTATLNLKHRAYQYVRSKLAEGDIQLGRGLSDRTLAKELGMSRTPVRAAIQQLATEGFVVQVPGSGTYPRRLTEEELIELYGLREVLEGYAAAQAARGMLDGKVAKLRKLCDDMSRLAKKAKAGITSDKLPALWSKAIALDDLFHRSILSDSNTRILPKIISDLDLMARMEADWQQTSLEKLAKSSTYVRAHREHLAIVEAIAARVPSRARNLMIRHVRKGRAHQLALITMRSEVGGSRPAKRRGKV